MFGVAGLVRHMRNGSDEPSLVRQGSKDERRPYRDTSSGTRGRSGCCPSSRHWLEALQANPEAFGSTFEVENALPLSWFSDRLGSRTVLGAFRDTELVGIACFVTKARFGACTFALPQEC